MKIDIGCGNRKHPGYTGIDLANADINYDLNKGIPLENNTVSNIYCSHFLEHSRDPLFVLSEMHRVCKNNAEIIIIVPLLEWLSHDHLHFFPAG